MLDKTMAITISMVLVAISMVAITSSVMFPIGGPGIHDGCDSHEGVFIGAWNTEDTVKLAFDDGFNITLNKVDDSPYMEKTLDGTLYICKNDHIKIWYKDGILWDGEVIEN